MITFETTSLGKLSARDKFVMSITDVPLDGDLSNVEVFRSFAYDGRAMTSTGDDPRAFKTGFTKDSTVVKITENFDFRGLI